MIKKVESNQRNIKFSFCKEPVTIDKSSEWGDGNLQNFPLGVFFKHDLLTDEVTHGVQPNETGTAPVGWVVDDSGFKKLPIHIGKELVVGTVTGITTLDGDINYEVTEPSFLCYNDDGNNKPDLKDCWAQTLNSIQKNYIF